MLHRLGEEAVGLYLDYLLGVVEGAEPHPFGAGEQGAVSDVAQATLLDFALSSPSDYLGVYVDAGVFLVGQLDDYEASQLSDLVGGEADPSGLAHGFHHVVGEGEELLIHAPDLSGALPQYGVRYRKYLSYSHVSPRSALEVTSLPLYHYDAMKILVSGSTGLIGAPLVHSLEASGHAVTRLLRPSSRHSGGGITWNPESGELDPSELEGFDAVIHLAGENVAARRWSAAQKARIRDSRVVGTGLLSEAIARLERKPAVFACASATGYYGDRGDEILDESAASGSDFLARVTAEWEEATAPAAASGVRTVNMRTSVVLTAGGGMLSKVLPIFKLGLGGKLGSGAQYMSWVSLDDMVGAIEWMLERDDLSGAVNVCAPNPVTNSEFTKALAAALGRPAMFAVPAFALRIAQGEMADIVMASARAIPTKLTDSGFEFRHPRIEDALRWALGDGAR